MHSSGFTLAAMVIGFFLLPLIALVWVCRKVKPFVRPVISAIVLGTLDHFRPAAS